MSPPSRRLLVFARDPQPGRVKTRLIPELGARGATSVYRRLLDIALSAAVATNADHCELWLDRPSDDSWLGQRITQLRLTPRIQSGDDLGARMHQALTSALGHADQAVIIGSDCPGYRADYLDAAFAVLDTHDAVVGPATDGGYVLIGLNRPAPRLFNDIAWGGPQVMATTRARLVEANLRWHELDALSDVDRPEDLSAFAALFGDIS